MLDFLRVFLQPFFTASGTYILSENKLRKKDYILTLLVTCTFQIAIPSRPKKGKSLLRIWSISLKLSDFEVIHN